MKILHINDLAGVAGVLCRYLRKSGHQADYLSFMDDWDFGYTEFYKGRHFRDQKLMLYFLKGLIPKYDIIHVHFSYALLDWINGQGFKTPVVMHYHGTELATNSDECKIFDRRAKKILVAGEQLLQYHHRGEYLPTIVDTEHFYSRKEPFYDGLALNIPYLDIEKVVEAWDSKGCGKLVIHDRANNTIPYGQMPEFLSQFKTYVDVRYHKQRGLLTDRSKTALEFLSCRGQVLTEKGEIIAGLPAQHKPENVIVQLIQHYAEVLKK